MEKYDLDFTTIKRVSEGSSYFTVKIKQRVSSSNALGDMIGVYEDDNILEFSDMIDIDDSEVQDFIRENFNNSMAVRGMIRRVI